MSMYQVVRRGVGALAVIGVMAACSSPTHVAGEPSAVGTPATSTSPAPGGTGQAPRVPAALPVQGILADPCTALASTQAGTIGLLVKGTPANLAAPACSWTSATSTSNEVFISPVPENKNGLSDTYTISANQKYKVFQPTTVDGYPGAYADPQDDRPNGTCTLWVGVTDQLAVMVEAQIGTGVNKSNPCPVAAKVGAAMIEHLKGAA